MWLIKRRSHCYAGDLSSVPKGAQPSITRGHISVLALDLCVIMLDIQLICITFTAISLSVLLVVYVSFLCPFLNSVDWCQNSFVFICLVTLQAANSKACPMQMQQKSVLPNQAPLEFHPLTVRLLVSGSGSGSCGEKWSALPHTQSLLDMTNLQTS